MTDRPCMHVHRTNVAWYTCELPVGHPGPWHAQVKWGQCVSWLVEVPR